MTVDFQKKTGEEAYTFLTRNLRNNLFCRFQTLLKLVETTTGVNKLLLTGEEGMALRANFNAHFAALGRSGLGLGAASTLDSYFIIFGMDALLHDHCSPC